MTEPSTIDTLTKHDNAPDFKDQVPNDAAVASAAEHRQQQQQRPSFAMEAIPLADASPVSYSHIDNERNELQARNRKLEEIILQQHQQQRQPTTPTVALSKKVWIRLGMLVTVVVASSAAMIAGIYCGTAAGNCRGGAGGIGSVSSPIAALAASPSFPPLPAPPTGPPNPSPVTATDTSTWTCSIGDSKVGEVTIDWGHTKGDSTWACNEWRAACKNSSCAAAPAESKWSCYVETKKVGDVTIYSGHMAGDAVSACNAQKIGGCAGQCTAGSTWNCKRGNATVAEPVEIWWSNNDGAATWACNQWRASQCNNSCQAENWIWTYFNPKTPASSAPTAAPTTASRL